MGEQPASTGTLRVRAALLAVLLAAAIPGLAAGQSHYELVVEFDVDSESGAYTATAEISELEEERVLAAPRVTGTLGQVAVARSGVPSESGTDEIELTLFAEAGVATSQLEVIRNGKVVAVLKSTVRY